MWQREKEAARTAKAATAPTGSPALGPAPVVAAANPAGGTFGFLAASDPAEARRRTRGINGQAIDVSYSALYRRLNWTPAQREQFKNLMLDAEESGERLFKSAVEAARAQNPSIDRAGLSEVFEVTREQMQREQEAEVRRVFGDAAGEKLAHYRATLPMRSIATQLATVLFNSESPITPAQADQLVEIMARNARSATGKVETAALNPEAALAQAQGLLNPLQLAELQRIATLAQERAKAERERNTAPAAAFKSSGK